MASVGKPMLVRGDDTFVVLMTNQIEVQLGRECSDFCIFLSACLSA